MSASLSALEGISHGFFGRVGGVSEGVYASLNSGFGSDDDPVRVQSNRARIAERLGTRFENLLTVYQVHGNDVVHVTQSWPREQSPRADGMVTRVPGFALGVLAADCAPVLFADDQAGVVGSAHAGWQGAIAGVTDRVIEEMEKLGAKTQRIRVAVGPCISQKNYEVGPEFHERFCVASAGNSSFFKPSSKPNHWMFALPEYVQHRVRGAGVENCELMQLCTYAHESDYFSFRRTTHQGQTAYGRNMSAIMLSR